MDQYETFKIDYNGRNYTRGQSFDGDLGEDISDNGGVKAAYRAFKKIADEDREQCIPHLPFNAAQLFWVKGITCLNLLFKNNLTQNDIFTFFAGWLCHGLLLLRLPGLSNI